MNLKLVVKNTFWNLVDLDVEALKEKSRAKSEPPRPNTISFSEQNRFADKCGQGFHGSHDKTQAGSLTEIVEKAKVEHFSADDVFQHRESKEQEVTCLASDHGHMKLCSQPEGHPAVRTITTSWPDKVLKQSLSGNAHKSGSHVNSSLSGSSNWWRVSPYTCPLCDFPIRLLPFPPFKFPMGEGRNMLVDGQFLAVQILSSWDFKVLGRMLARDDIQALDAHVKSRKLCCSLIGDAIALMLVDDIESQADLALIRSAARDKLELLKKMKRIRLSRLSIEHPSPWGVRSNAIKEI